MADIQKEWLEILTEEFDHPSVVLWRAVELREIARVLESCSLREPILDLGCAEGKIARLLLRGREIVGLDNTWELLCRNPSHDPYRGVTLGDAVAMPFAAGRFGSVFSNCVIEHIPDLSAVLCEINRILRPQGLFVFTVPSASFVESLSVSSFMKALGCSSVARWYARKRNASLSHFHCYDHGHWEQLLQQHGFVLRRHVYYLSRKATIVWDIWAIVWRFLGPLLGARGRHRLNKMLIKRLKTYYNIYSATGSALLIVAQKEHAKDR